MEYLYLIRCDEFVKIGIACDVKNRLKTLQTGNPYSLALIESFEFDDAVRVESILHRKYDHARTRGEWFKLTDAEIEELIGLCQNFDENKIEMSPATVAGILASALNYCKEAGLVVESYNEGTRLILEIDGLRYADEDIQVVPVGEVTP